MSAFTRAINGKALIFVFRVAVLLGFVWPLSASAAVDPAPRVYIHYHDASQAAGAEAFRAALTGKRISGKTLTALIPAGEPRSSLARTALLCQTSRDCALSDAIANQIRSLTGQAVAIDKRIASGPQNANRPLHFEIWFDALPIAVVPASAKLAAAPATVQATDLSSGGPVPIVTGASGSGALQVQVAVTGSLQPGASFTASLPAATATTNESVSVLIDNTPAAVTRVRNLLPITVPALPQRWIRARDVALGIQIGNPPRLSTRTLLSLAPHIELQDPRTLLSAGAAIIILVLGLFAVRSWFRSSSSTKLTVNSVIEATDDAVKAFEKAPKKDATQPNDPTLPDAPVPEGLAAACAFSSAILYTGPDFGTIAGIPSYAALLRTILSQSDGMDAAARKELAALLDRGQADTVADTLLQVNGHERYARFVSASNSNQERPDSLRRLDTLGAFKGAIVSGFDDLALRMLSRGRRLTLADDYDFADLLHDRKRRRNAALTWPI